MVDKKKSHSLDLSAIVAGMWRLNDWRMSPQKTLGFIQECVDIGVTTFDHADIYGDYQCEQLFGKAILNQSHLRQKIQLVSKCGIKLVSKQRPEHRIKQYDTSYQHIIKSAENSLRLLKTDYLDCLLIHRPDPLMNASEVARAFEDLIQQGKIKAAGVSNFTPYQFELLQEYCSFKLAVNQIEVSVCHIDALFDGSIDSCQKHGTIPMAWSPLGGGILFAPSAANASDCTEKISALTTTLKEIGNQHGATIDQIAIAWLLKHPSKIKPILGTGNIERVKNACKADQIELSNEEWYTILQQSSGSEVA